MIMGAGRSWGRFTALAVVAVCLGGAGLLAAPPAVAAPGVPQLVLGNGTASGDITLTSMATVNVPVTLPTISIPSSGLIIVTYRPSTTIGIRWRGCTNSALVDNDVNVDCFWVPAAGNADGSVEQSATVTWTQIGQLWAGAAGTTIPFTPRNMATSPAGAYLVPYIRVYAEPSSGGRSPAGMNAEFSPDPGTPLGHVTGPGWGTPMPESPSLNFASPVVNVTANADLTIQRSAMSFADAGSTDVANTFSGHITMTTCPAGGLPPDPMLSGWGIKGPQPIPRGMKGQSEPSTSKGCKAAAVWQVADQAGSTGAPAEPINLSVLASTLVLTPLPVDSSVQLTFWLTQTGVFKQVSPLGYTMTWWVSHNSAPQTITIASPLPSKPGAVDLGSGSSEPSTPAPSGGSSGAGSAVATIAAAGGIDLARAPEAGTAGQGTLAGRTLVLKAPSALARGRSLRITATVKPGAPGKVRFVLALVGASGQAEVATVKVASVRKGRARVVVPVPQSLTKGVYTLLASYLPSKDSVTGLTVSRPLRIR